MPAQGMRHQLWLLSLMVLLPSGAAVAGEDEKIFPGTLCQPAKVTSTFTRDLSGRMMNTGSVDRTFICPIVTDSQTYPNSFEYAEIIVIGRSVTCKLEVSNEQGEVHARLNFPSSIVPLPNNTYTHRYGEGDPNINKLPNDKAFFSCTIPPASGVITYKVSEND